MPSHWFLFIVSKQSAIPCINLKAGHPNCVVFCFDSWCYRCTLRNRLLSFIVINKCWLLYFSWRCSCPLNFFQFLKTCACFTCCNLIVPQSNFWSPSSGSPNWHKPAFDCLLLQSAFSPAATKHYLYRFGCISHLQVDLCVSSRVRFAHLGFASLPAQDALSARRLVPTAVWLASRCRLPSCVYWLALCAAIESVQCLLCLPVRRLQAIHVQSEFTQVSTGSDCRVPLSWCAKT